MMDRTVHEVMSVYCVDVSLSIPDNEAMTALRTLRRLGVEVGGLARADVYRCDVERRAYDAFIAAFRSIETLFNPNKHVLRVREGERPAPGEVWIDERAHEPAGGRRAETRVAGRLLPGVGRFERFTGWRLTAADGSAAPAPLVAAATETLLCNPAFQRATTV